MKRVLQGFVLALALAGTSNAAVTNDQVVHHIANIAAVQSKDWSAYYQFVLDGAVTTGDPGAGTFTSCPGCIAADGGVILTDLVGNKWKRHFTGPVHTGWYPSAVDATGPTCVVNYSVCDTGNLFNIALAASTAYGDGWVYTDGVSLVANSVVPVIPANGGIDCSLPAGSLGPQSQTSQLLYKKTNSIVINPILLPTGVYTPSYTKLRNCLIRPTTLGKFRPGGYIAGNDYVPTTVKDSVMLRQLYTGFGVTSVGQGTPKENLQIIGFDTAMSVSGSPNTRLEHIVSDANVHLDVWGERAGMNGTDWSGVQLNGHISANGVPISTIKTPITSITKDGSGQVVLGVNNIFNSLSNCVAFTDCMQPGWTVIVNGLGDPITHNQTQGDVDITQPTIQNVANNEGNGQDGIGSVQPGATITDTGAAGCSFTGIVVGSTDPGGNGALGTIYLVDATTQLPRNPTGCAGGNPAGTAKNEALTFVSSSAGGAGINGSYLAGTVTTGPDGVTLIGSSYDGPQFTDAKWDAGMYSIKVRDVSQVHDGQFIVSIKCSTMPFCNSPTAFRTPNITSSDVATLGPTGGNMTVSTTAGMPSFGYLEFVDGCTEYMVYQLKQLPNHLFDPTQINIQTRGWETTTCTHSNGQPIVVGPPSVVQVVPNDGHVGEPAVITINQAALTTESTGQAIQAANDNTVTTGLAGSLILNNVYGTYSSNPYTAGSIWGPVTVKGKAASGSAVLNTVAPTYKIMPGMVPVDDNNKIPSRLASPVTTTGTWSFPAMSISVASGANIYPGMQISGSGLDNDTFVLECFDVSQNPCNGATGAATVKLSHATTGAKNTQAVSVSGVVVIGVSGSNVTLNIAATGTDSIPQYITFTGCGWPFRHPEQGTCTASGAVIGSLTDQSTQGVVLDYFHVGQLNNQIIMNNAPATIIKHCVLSNGSGKGAQIDEKSVGIAMRGKVSNNNVIDGCKVAGSTTSLFVDGNAQSSGIRVLGSYLGDSGGTSVAVIGPVANITFSADSSGNPGIFYYSDQVVSMNVSAFNGPFTQVIVPSAVAQNAVSFTFNGNTFATLYGGDSLGLSIGTPAGGTMYGAINTLNGALRNGIEYLSAVSPFTVFGGTAPTTLPVFGDRHFSLLDGGAIPNGSDMTTQVNNAISIAQTNNIHDVWVDPLPGIGQTYKISTLIVPAGIRLICPGPLPQAPASLDYRGMLGFVVTNNHGFVNNGGSIENCTIIQNNMNGVPPVSLQDFQARKAAYVGIGMQCALDPCSAKNNLIVGFDSPIYAKGARGGSINDNRLDGNWCLNIPSQAGGGLLSIHTNTCNSYGTGSGPVSITTISLASFSDNGSGELHSAYASTCNTTNCPLNGWLASVIQPPAAQSAGGEHNLENVTTSGFDLVGTTSLFLTGYGVTANVSSGSTLVTGFTTHLDQYKKGQNVTGATCIPVNDQIAAFFYWNNQGYMELTAPATCTVTETVTTTDDALTAVGVTKAVIDTPGTCFTAGDLVTLNGGSLAAGGNAAVLIVNNITPDLGCSDPTTGIPQAPLGISDPGFYTSLPGSGATVTGGTGTGLTVDAGSTAQLVIDSALRPNPAADIINVNDVDIDGFKELYHAIGIKTSVNASGVNVDHCDLHDNNYDGARRIGVWISGNSKAVNIHCNTYYAGVGWLYDRTSLTSVAAANTLSGFVGGSAGNTTGQNELFEIHSSTQGTAGKGDLVLQDVYSRVTGVGFFGDDASGGSINAVRLPQTTTYAQSATTAANWCGAGNSFVPGSMPVYSVCGTEQIKPGTAYGAGGAMVLTNVSSTYFPYTNGTQVLDRGALTNNRNLTLSNIGATNGYPVSLTRKGSSGGFNRNVFQADGTTLIANVADNANADFEFDTNTNLWFQK